MLVLTAINSSFPLGFGPRDSDPAWLPASGFLDKPVEFNAVLEKIASTID